MPSPLLFEPISFRSVTARNRLVVAPMCQYSADDGLGDDWHVQHLGARAMGGAGIVFTEATHVSAIGRITPWCLGLWNAGHQALLTRLAAIISRGGAVPGIQIAHAGRKASTTRTWEGSKPIAPRGWWLGTGRTQPDLVPSRRGRSACAVHRARSPASPAEFAASARMAREAGFKVVEIHAAHGYLLHSFLSPISNHRNDGYGGDLDGRSRFLMETLDAVRAEWPAELPLFVRLSCVDYLPGGLTIEDTVTLCRKLAARGDVDLIDCSSGGVSPDVRIPTHPGYQVPFAEAVKRGAGIATGAVGLITEPTHAAEIVANERADLVFLARILLADPAWPLRAAMALGVKPELPPQYWRATLA